ncbi:hypothetical protein [Marinomonas epiphytica]
MKRSNSTIYVLLICWLAYFSVPTINNVGIFNGVYVMLCVTRGVMIHDPGQALADNSHSSHQHHSHHQHQHQHHNEHHNHQIGQDLQTVSLHSSGAHSSDTHNAEEHEAEGCPCIHFFYDTNLFLASKSQFIKPQNELLNKLPPANLKHFYKAQARAPPGTNEYFSYNSLHLMPNYI